MLNCFRCFSESLEFIKPDIALDPWQSADGIVVDTWWAIEHTIEMFGPPFQDSIFICQKCDDICTKKWNRSIVRYKISERHTPPCKVMHVNVSADMQDMHLNFQIIGLTASVGVGKAKDVKQAVQHIKSLMANLDSAVICTVQNNMSELRRYVNVPDEGMSQNTGFLKE